MRADKIEHSVSSLGTVRCESSTEEQINILHGSVEATVEDQDTSCQTVAPTNRVCSTDDISVKTELSVQSGSEWGSTQYLQSPTEKMYCTSCAKKKKKKKKKKIVLFKDPPCTADCIPPGTTAMEVTPHEIVTVTPGTAVMVTPDTAVKVAPEEAVKVTPDTLVMVTQEKAVNVTPDKAVKVKPDTNEASKLSLEEPLTGDMEKQKPQEPQTASQNYKKCASESIGRQGDLTHWQTRMSSVSSKPYKQTLNRLKMVFLGEQRN